MTDKVLTCAGCGKQRWAPRVPEAFHGWNRLASGAWRCPDCASASNSQEPRQDAAVCSEQWNVGDPSGMNGPFFSVISSTGQVIALQVPGRKLAERLCRLPLLEQMAIRGGADLEHGR